MLIGSSHHSTPASFVLRAWWSPGSGARLRGRRQCTHTGSCVINPSTGLAFDPDLRLLSSRHAHENTRWLLTRSNFALVLCELPWRLVHELRCVLQLEATRACTNL